MAEQVAEPEETKKKMAENLVKLLLRNLKMEQAKGDVARVLKSCDDHIRIEEKLRNYLSSALPRADESAKMYSDLVRISSRIYKMIDMLKDSEKCFDRPFMFKKKRYDDNIHYEMRDLRIEMLERIPNLKDHDKLKLVLLANGEIADMREIKPAPPKAADELKKKL